MSPANVATVRRGIAAYNARDIDTIYELATDDFEWVPVIPVSFEGGSVRGREGMEAYFAEVDDMWEEYGLTTHELRDLGNRVLVLGHLKGRGRVSGPDVDTPWAAIFDFREGRMSRARAFLDYGEALKAVGLED